MGKHFIATEAFGAHAKGDIVTDDGQVAAIEAGEQQVYGVLVNTTLIFDGAQGTPQPSIGDGGLSAIFPLTTSSVATSVLSSGIVSSGRQFVAMLVEMTGAFNIGVAVGFANAAFDAGNIGTLGGNCALIGSQNIGTNDFEIDNDTAVLSSETLASGAVIMGFVDFGAQSWGGITPDGMQHDNAQADVGVGGHDLGMPAGPLRAMALLEGGTTASTGTCKFTMLTNAALALLGKAGPSGYTNVAG